MTTLYNVEKNKIYPKNLYARLSLIKSLYDMAFDGNLQTFRFLNIMYNMLTN